MNFEERYQLQLPLSQRENGTVWKAHDVKLAREVAVAVLESDAPDAVQFEARIAKLVALRNAHLARAFDAGRNAEGDLYASFELAEGVCLRDRMRDGPPIKIDQAVRMVMDVANALGALHAVDLAHGDVEPGNIYVKEAAGRLVPKLVGLALNRAEQRSGRASLDERHVQVLAYTAPEQAAGSDPDAAGDVYALAGVLFSILTGRLPHRGEGVEGLRKSIASRNVPALGDLRGELEGPLAEVIDTALAPEAKDRYPTADAFAKALRGALARVRNPGAMETIAGERALADDDSDDALSAKRLEPRPKAAPAPAAAPPKGKLPLGKLPPKAPPKAALGAKPEPKAEAKEDAKTEPKEEKEEQEEAKPEAQAEAKAEPEPFEPEPLPFETKADPFADDEEEEKETAEAPPIEEEEEADEPKEEAKAEEEEEVEEEPRAPEPTTEEAVEEEIPVEEHPAEEEAPVPIAAAPVEEVVEKEPASPPPSTASPEHAYDDEPLEKPAGLPVWIYAVGGLAAAAVLAVVVYAAVGGDDETPVAESTPDEEVAAPEEDPVEEPAVEESFVPDEPIEEEAEPEPVVLTLNGVPEGARVTIDGEETEGSRVELPSSELERTVEVSLDGHEPWTTTVAGDESAELDVALEPIEEEEPVAEEQPERRAQAARRRPPRVRRPPRERTAARRPTGDRPTAVSNPGF